MVADVACTFVGDLNLSCWLVFTGAGAFERRGAAVLGADKINLARFIASRGTWVRSEKHWNPGPPIPRMRVGDRRRK